MSREMLNNYKTKQQKYNVGSHGLCLFVGPRPEAYGWGRLSHVNAQGHCVIICTAPWLLSTCSKGRKVFPSEVDIQTSIIVIYL